MEIEKDYLKCIKENIKDAAIIKKHYRERGYNLSFEFWDVLFGCKRKLYIVKLKVNGHKIVISTPWYLGFGKPTSLKIDGKEYCGYYRNRLASRIHSIVFYEVIRRNEMERDNREELVNTNLENKMKEIVNSLNYDANGVDR